MGSLCNEPGTEHKKGQMREIGTAEGCGLPDAWPVVAYYPDSQFFVEPREFFATSQMSG